MARMVVRMLRRGAMPGDDTQDDGRDARGDVVDNSA